MMHTTTWTISKEESYGEGKKPDGKGSVLRSSGRDTDLCKRKTAGGCLWRMREGWRSGKEQGGFPGLRKSAIAWSVRWLCVIMPAVKTHWSAHLNCNTRCILLLFSRCVCFASLLRRVRLFVTPWTAALQAPLPVGILQARTVEWVAMPFSRGSSQPRDQTQVSALQADAFPSEPPGEPCSLTVVSVAVFILYLNKAPRPWTHKPVFSISYPEGRKGFNASRRKRERQERKRRKVKEGRRQGGRWGAGKEETKEKHIYNWGASPGGLYWYLSSWHPSQWSISPRRSTF